MGMDAQYVARTTNGDLKHFKHLPKSLEITKTETCRGEHYAYILSWTRWAPAFDGGRDGQDADRWDRIKVELAAIMDLPDVVDVYYGDDCGDTSLESVLARWPIMDRVAVKLTDDHYQGIRSSEL